MPLMDSSVDCTLAQERIHELKDMSIDISKTEMQREKIMKKNGTEYPRTMGQFQKV